MAVVAPLVPLMPLFLLAHGKDIEITQGAAFTVYTVADAPVAISDAPPPVVVVHPSTAPTTEHVIEGYTLSGPDAPGTVGGVEPENSVAEASRIAKAKRAAQARSVDVALWSPKLTPR
jgi:hypothetical protein